MAIRLIVHPGEVVSWDEFKRFPPYSIAMDGFCRGPPRSSPDGLRLNLNHHEGVDRVATRSSCDQALVNVKLGLYRTFQKGGEPTADVYVNDCDQDIGLGTYILCHSEHADRPKLKQLVRMEDLLDMSAGLYPMPKRSHLMRQLAWINEPYTKVRAEERLHELGTEGMREVIEKMHRRIRKALFGKVREVTLDTEFEIVAQYPRWCLVREVGQQARIGMAEKGVEAFVTVLAANEGGHRYSLGRLSLFIPFPLVNFYEELNRAEGIASDDPDRWGGSRTCGGSPRIRGSRLSPPEVAEVINHFLAHGANGRSQEHAPR